MTDSEGNTPDSSPSPAYSEDGVDLTLVRWMLSLTPAERPEVLQRHIDDVLMIRELQKK